MQPDISEFFHIKSPTVNKQTSDNLFFRCHFSKRERQQERGEERVRRRAHHVTSHSSEIDGICQNYPGRAVRCAQCQSAAFTAVRLKSYLCVFDRVQEGYKVLLLIKLNRFTAHLEAIGSCSHSGKETEKEDAKILPNAHFFLSVQPLNVRDMQS